MQEDSESAGASDSSHTEQIERDNARTQYAAAISLGTHEGSNLWVRYGLMLVVQTIMLSVFGLTSNVPQPAKNLIWITLSSAGLALCVLWWILNGIGWRYFFYWMFAARELEERYLGPVRTVSRAFPVADEGDVSVVVGGMRLPLPIARKDRFRVVLVSRLIIFMFGLLHGVMLLTFLISLWR